MSERWTIKTVQVSSQPDEYRVGYYRDGAEDFALGEAGSSDPVIASVEKEVAGVFSALIKRRASCGALVFGSEALAEQAAELARETDRRIMSRIRQQRRSECR